MIHYFNITKDEFDLYKIKDSIILNTTFDWSISQGDYVVFREVVDGVITRSHPIKTIVKSVITEKRTLFYSITWIIELEKCKDESDVININELKLESGLHFLIENKLDKQIVEVFVNDIQRDFIKYSRTDFIQYSRTRSKHNLYYPNAVIWKRIDDFKKELSEYDIVHIISKGYNS